MTAMPFETVDGMNKKFDGEYLQWTVKKDVNGAT